MVEITSEMYMGINIACFVFYVAMFFLGYKKGILRTVIDLIGTIACVWLAWTGAPVLSDFVRIIPIDLVPMQDTVISTATYHFCNELVWFLILFVTLKIVVALLENISKGVQKVPGIHLVSAVLGGVFQLGVGLIWTLVFSVMLSLPVFVNGNEAVNNTVIGVVRDQSYRLASDYIEPFMQSEAFTTLFDDAMDLQSEQQERIRTWLLEHGYNYSDEQIESSLGETDYES